MLSVWALCGWSVSGSRERAVSNPMGQACTKAMAACLKTKSVCKACQGAGKCPGCGGKGYVDLKDRVALRNEKRKDHLGNIIPEVISVKLPDEQRPCVKCGGWGEIKPIFRGSIGTASPVDYRGDLSPPKGRHGDGKCRMCKGTGNVIKPIINLHPRINPQASIRKLDLST